MTHETGLIISGLAFLLLAFVLVLAKDEEGMKISAWWWVALGALGAPSIFAVLTAAYLG